MEDIQFKEQQKKERGNRKMVQLTPSRNLTSQSSWYNQSQTDEEANVVFLYRHLFLPLSFCYWVCKQAPPCPVLLKIFHLPNATQ